MSNNVNANVLNAMNDADFIYIMRAYYVLNRKGGIDNSRQNSQQFFFRSSFSEYPIKSIHETIDLILADNERRDEAQDRVHGAVD